MLDLKSIKRDQKLLMAVLGADKIGQHVKCPLHEDSHGSMAIWEHEDGVWFWKCHAGCGGGTIIDALMQVYGLSSPSQALKKLEDEFGIKLRQNEEIVEPKIDKDRAERLIAAAHEFLMNDIETQEELLEKKRGIYSMDAVTKYRLGFLPSIKFKGWKWNMRGWVIPVTKNGVLVGVKIHQEGRRDPKSPKALWAPFGTYPSDKPKNGCITLWPEPSGQDCKGKTIHLCPGELKSLACISCGVPSTSPTTGENGKFRTHLCEMLYDAGFRQVIIHDDGDKASSIWYGAAKEALEKRGIVVVRVDLNDLINKNQAKADTSALSSREAFRAAWNNS